VLTKAAAVTALPDEESWELSAFSAASADQEEMPWKGSQIRKAAATSTFHRPIHPLCFKNSRLSFNVALPSCVLHPLHNAAGAEMNLCSRVLPWFISGGVINFYLFPSYGIKFMHIHNAQAPRFASDSVFHLQWPWKYLWCMWNNVHQFSSTRFRQ
jgi:hypothetical protein